MIQNLLTNILIAPNVISKDGIDFILNHVKNKPKEDLLLYLYF